MLHEKIIKQLDKSDSKKEKKKIDKGHEIGDWLCEDKCKCYHNKNFLNTIIKATSCQSWVELVNKIIVMSKDIK